MGMSPLVSGLNQGGYPPGQYSYPGQPQQTATAGTQNAGGFAGQGLSSADQANLLTQSGNQNLGQQQLVNAGQQNIANTQAGANMYGSNMGALSSLGGDVLQGANTYNNTGQQGQYNMLNTIAGNETSPAMEANLYKQGVGNQFLSAIAPMLGQIFGMLPGAIGNVLGGGAGGGQGLPPGASGPANSPIPLSVMNPYSAQGLINDNAGSTAASTANQLGAVTPQGASPALAQQLMGQGLGANRAGLTDATSSFLAQLAPMNAQQALSGAQTAEGQRANYLGNLLARQQVGTSNTGNLLKFISQLTGNATGGIL